MAALQPLLQRYSWYGAADSQIGLAGPGHWWHCAGPARASGRAVYGTVPAAPWCWTTPGRDRRHESPGPMVGAAGPGRTRDPGIRDHDWGARRPPARPARRCVNL
eukprot:141919-Hanusia_phi.AAC.1